MFGFVSDFFKRAYLKIVNSFGSNCSQNETECLDNTDYSKLVTYAYCLAEVVKADGAISDEEREMACNFFVAKFGNGVASTFAIRNFNFYLKSESESPLKIDREFFDATTYAERYAFAEMLFSIAVNSFKFLFCGISGNVASVIKEIMRLLMLEKGDVEYLCGKYYLNISDGEKTDDLKCKESKKKARNVDKFKVYAYCFAVVAKADGAVSNEERRKLSEYMSDRFVAASDAIAHFNRLVNGRIPSAVRVPKEFINDTSYIERYNLVEALFAFALIKQGNGDKGINSNVADTILKLMAAFELKAADIQSLCEIYHIRGSKQSKDSGRRFTFYGSSTYDSWNSNSYKKTQQRQRN